MNDFSTVPPYTNRGAQNTKQVGLIACVDWVQVTFLHVTNPHDVITLLGLQNEDFQAFETGKYGYPFHMRLGHIAIYYSDTMPSVHLEITGQGCREYEQLQKYDWSVLFGLILMLPVNVTRLDLAIDDYKGYFKIATIYRKLKSGHALSKFKTFRYMVQAKIKSKEITGQTVYVGSPQSRLMIRFYDKLAERKNKNFEIQDGITCWNRTEIQLRDERALAAATLIANEKNSVGELIQGTLKNYINFINPTKLKNGNIDTNKSRWNVCDFWTSFLGDVEPLSLTEKAPDKTIEQTKSWFDKNMTATLSMLYEAFDNNESLIKEWLEKGLEKRSKRHENMLQRFLEEKQLLEDNKRKKKMNLIGKKFDYNENGQLRLKARKITIKEAIKEIVEVEPEEYDERLADLLKDKFIFIKKKKAQINKDPDHKNI